MQRRMARLERELPSNLQRKVERRKDDEFQRPRSVRFRDEQTYTMSKEEREELELLGHVAVWDVV